MNIIGNTLNELYRIFGLLNKVYFENKLPDPVITIQKTRPNNLGHFTLYKAWKNKDDKENEEAAKYEININPLNLNRPVEEIVGTLQHEMVHYANKLNDIKDCNGQVHNKKFKDLAENVGLICEKSQKYGWGYTTLSNSFMVHVNEEVKPDEKCFEYFRDVGVQKAKKESVKKIFKYSCPNCDLEVKSKPDKQIKCGNCEVDLIMECD